MRSLRSLRSRTSASRPDAPGGACGKPAMTNDEFRRHAHELVDWMADYLDGIESLPVRPSVHPGDILRQLPAAPPEEGEPFENIFGDFKSIILPGMTHWQHPSFFAYF